ncbi:hypothetical protein V2H45_24440, partial [Tumidithrix elongata RA019]|nr:hypothetical protein [Tumidithrix elongata RA019]
MAIIYRRFWKKKIDISIGHSIARILVDTSNAEGIIGKMTLIDLSPRNATTIKYRTDLTSFIMANKDPTIL